MGGRPLDARRSLRALIPLCGVNQSWRRCAEPVCRELFDVCFDMAEDFYEVLHRRAPPGFSLIRAAQQLLEWYEEPASAELDSLLVAGLVACYFGAERTSRFRFRRASKIVKCREYPESSENDETHPRNMEEYKSDDGPVIKRGGLPDEGFEGKICHQISIGISNNKDLVEIRGEMFFEILDEDCTHYASMVLVTIGPSTRVNGKTAAQKVLLEWKQEWNEERVWREGIFNDDVAEDVVGFFDEESIEETMSTLVKMLKAIFNYVNGPFIDDYGPFIDDSPTWSHQLATLIKRARFGADASSDESEDASSDESEDEAEDSSEDDD